MSNQSEQPAQIYIFPLADPHDLYLAGEEVLKTLLSAIEPDLSVSLKPEYNFSINPVCGWIRYSLKNDLWHAMPKRGLPQNAEAATKAAKDFITRLIEACRQKEYRELKIPPLLPTEPFARVVPAATTPVFHFGKPWVDHWLCRFEVYLKPFSEQHKETQPLSSSLSSGSSTLHQAAASIREERQEARVFGGGIDIRIGQKGKVTGFVSHWRPAFLEKAKLVQMFHPQAEEEEHHSGEENSPPTLIYELHGETGPQTFITPYYLSLEGHHGGMFPASSHSLIVEMGFAEKEDGGSAYVLPWVFGGSGDYTLNWAYWRPDELFEEGLVSKGQQPFIELPLGTYNVMLHVTDNQTGVIQLYESMAFVKGEPPMQADEVI